MHETSYLYCIHRDLHRRDFIPGMALNFFNYFNDSKCTSDKDEAYQKTGGEPNPDDYEKLYFKAEFTAMDKENRGKLTTSEFVKLMMFLGYGERWKVDVSRQGHSSVHMVS